MAASKKKVRKKTSKKTASKKKTTKKAGVKKKAAKKAKKVTKKTGKKTRKSAGKTTGKSAGKKTTRRRVISTTKNGLIHGIVPYKPKKGEEYMNQAQLAHFRGILEAWRQSLVDEINRTILSIQDETISHPDPNDRATQETDMSLELRSRDRERKLIRKIDGTLSIIDSGDYGFCEKCGVEIGIARLEARPTASLCIDCKTLDEIREKQMV